MASTRKQAKAQGLKHYFTGVPCKNGHISQRTTLDYTCVVCNQVNTERYNLLNREKYLESKKNIFSTLENENSEFLQEGEEKKASPRVKANMYA
jgi:hypothetical protein